MVSRCKQARSCLEATWFTWTKTRSDVIRQHFFESPLYFIFFTFFFFLFSFSDPLFFLFSSFNYVHGQLNTVNFFFKKVKKKKEKKMQVIQQQNNLMDFKVLSRYDDLFTDIFLDNLFLWFNTIKMNNDHRRPRVPNQKILDIIQRNILENARPMDAVNELLAYGFTVPPYV